MRRFVVDRWKDILLVLAVLALGLTSQFWWLWHHHVPPEADYGLHLAEAAAFQAVAECPGDLAERLVTLWTWPGPYPPMVYLVTWLVTGFLPSGSYAALASLSVFLVCLVTGAYILGSSAGGRVAGLMAALLVEVDPVIMSCMHRYWVDMPVAAMVVLSLALLHLCRGFTSRGWSLALGACLGCGMASKFTLCWFLAVPLLAAMVPPWWREGKRERFWFLGLVVGLAMVFKVLCMVGWADGSHYMQGRDTTAPVLSYQLVGSWLVAIVVCWVFARSRLNGALRNLCHALCLVGLLIGPWVMANQAMIKGRWNPVEARISQNLAELPAASRELLEVNVWPVLVAGLAGLLIIPLLKERRAAMMPVILAFLSGTALTLVILPVSSRYMAPSQALLTVLAVSWLPRTPFVTLPILLGVVALSSVNLFTDMALARCHGLGRWLDAGSLYTRRFVVDQVDFAYEDYEPFARELVSRLGPELSSVYVLGRPSETDNLGSLYYMLAAEAGWRGRVIACRLIRYAEGRTEHMQLCVLEPDRTRMQARRRGLHLDHYPSMFDRDGFTPQYIVLPCSVEKPGDLARSLYGAAYERVDFPPEYGFTVLRCSGSFGRQASAAPGGDKDVDPSRNSPSP